MSLSSPAAPPVRRSRTAARAVLLLALAPLAACAPDTADPAADDPTLLASWEGGRIDVARLDRQLLALDAVPRVPRGDELDGWLERQLLRAFERAVLTSPENLARLADDDAFQLAWHRQRRQLLARAWLDRQAPPQPVSRDEVRAYYESHRDELDAPERRVLYNLLLAFPPAADEATRDAICSRAEELRREIETGTSFEQLAARHSDSATAVNGGFVGLVRRDQLRADAAEPIFSLEAGRVSPVLRNPAGCQLFLVQQVFPAVHSNFAALEAKLTETVTTRRQAERLAGLLAATAGELGVALPSPAEAAAALAAGPDAVLLEIDGESVTGREVAARRESGTDFETALDGALAALVFSRAFGRELGERPGEPGSGQRELEPLAGAYEEGAYHYLRRHALLDRLRSLPEATFEQFYTDHRERFVTDPQLELTVFSWPIGDGDPIASLARPQAFTGALVAAGGRPEEVWPRFADDPGVTRTTLPLTGFRELAAGQPVLARALLDDLAEGDVVPPYRVGDRLWVVLVETLIPSRPLSYLEARDDVVTAYGESEGPSVEAGLREELIAEHGLVVHRQSLDRFGELLVERLARGGGEAAGADGTDAQPRGEG